MLITKCHPELDQTPLLKLNTHHKYQMMVGILQWMVIISKPELCQVSLNCFGSCSYEGHLDLMVRCFGYITTTISKKITIDSRPMKFNRTAPNFTKLNPDFINDYPDVKEDIDAIV